MIDLPATASPMISKAWARLEELKLIRRGRRGQLASITVLKEDGSGSGYTHPGGSRDDPYLRLPFDYWEDGWDTNLSLPGKAALLIALSQPEWFGLPEERAQDWYGLSGDTLGRGLAELRRALVLEARPYFKKAPLAPAGYTKQLQYRLRPPFHKRRAKEAATVTPPPLPTVPLEPRASSEGRSHEVGA
jgi:hypothetical protein